MADAAGELLASLDEPRRRALSFRFDDEERFRWNYRPDGLVWQGKTIWHEGLRLVNMTEAQQRAAFTLLATGLSARGVDRAHAIMTLEKHLRETERVAHWVPHAARDPELYAFAIFGAPGGPAPWGWRAGGHHLGLHFTIVDGDRVAPFPLFFGANPAEVKHGSAAGLRTLPDEEDLGHELLRSLDDKRRALAIVSAHAPGDIITDAHRGTDPLALPVGIAFRDMTSASQETLVRLVRLYTDRATDEIARAQWSRIEAAGLDDVTFAWAGGSGTDDGHYYAVRGPTFVIEYDKTQDDANHVHSVMRDFQDDWGEDLLARHYAESHGRT